MNALDAGYCERTDTNNICSKMNESSSDLSILSQNVDRGQVNADTNAYLYKKNTEYFEFIPMQLTVWIKLQFMWQFHYLYHLFCHPYPFECLLFWFWGSSNWSKADGDLYQRIYCFDRFFSQRIHDQLWNEIRWIRIENATDRGIIANCRSKGTHNIHFFMLSMRQIKIVMTYAF